MDHRSILDLSSAPSVEGDMAGGGVSRPLTASVSAGIAAANAHPKSPEAEPRFPGEDGGHSLARMAELDLDAALQLLAERAQYITGANGAAIALRRGEHNDMLCRASAGSNAPELGALLSMEYGLSGESVRTRQALRCDDTESDPRVNREGCRQLGIASVVVMPIVSEQQVLGVFELFSGAPRAFEERDLSALQRLSEMVETAVRHAVAAQSLQVAQKSSGVESQSSGDGIAADAVPIESAGNAISPDLTPAPVELKKDAPPETKETVPEKTAQEVAEAKKAELEKAEPEPAQKNPLFWSASTRTPTGAGQVDESAETISVPLELRNLQKCKACGFPVSQGRTLCVECEEKQWRGQSLAQAPASSVTAGPEQHSESQPEPEVVPASGVAPEISVSKDSSSSQTSPSQASVSQTSALAVDPAVGEAAMAVPSVESLPQSTPQTVSENEPTADDSTLFLSSAAPSESWFKANKYVLGALLVVAIVISAIAWLR
jgi:hypothetical protein